MCAIYICNVSQVSVLVTGMGELWCLPWRRPCSSSSQPTGDGRTCFFPISSSEFIFKLSFCLCTNRLLSNIPKIVGSEPEGKIRESKWTLFPLLPPPFFFFSLLAILLFKFGNELFSCQCFLLPCGKHFSFQWSRSQHGCLEPASVLCILSTLS